MDSTLKLIFTIQLPLLKSSLKLFLKEVKPFQNY
jgi:hypothetical protein